MSENKEVYKTSDNHNQNGIKIIVYPIDSKDFIERLNNKDNRDFIVNVSRFLQCYNKN